MSNLWDRLDSFVQTISEPLPQVEIQTLAEEMFPELHRISAASSPEERVLAVQQLKTRLAQMLLQDELRGTTLALSQAPPV